MSLRQNITSLLLAPLLLSTNAAVWADVCTDYAAKSVQQQEKNVFNLCGFHGSQWSNDSQRWFKECQTMSTKDVRNRLMMRDKFLEQCPVINYSGSGRNRQSKLLMALLRATELQDYRLVGTLIDEGVNLATQPDWMVSSPLFIATMKNDLRMARLLTTNGAKPYLLAKGEDNLLCLLLKQPKTNYAFLEYLLMHKANPNVSANGKMAEYPLEIAAAKGDFRSTTLLLKYRGNPNLYYERPALQFAVEQDHYPISRALIKKGANPNLGIGGKVCHGKMALDIAFRMAKDRIIDLLLDNRALTLRECEQRP